MTQRERILNALKVAQCDDLFATPWVCGVEFLNDYMPRYAARIAELREAGHRIISERCPDHPTFRYQLVEADDEMA